MKSGLRILAASAICIGAFLLQSEQASAAGHGGHGSHGSRGSLSRSIGRPMQSARVLSPGVYSGARLHHRLPGRDHAHHRRHRGGYGYAVWPGYWPYDDFWYDDYGPNYDVYADCGWIKVVKGKGKKRRTVRVWRCW